jgi:hypothetical protein
VQLPPQQSQQLPPSQAGTFGKFMNPNQNGLQGQQQVAQQQQQQGGFIRKQPGRPPNVVTGIGRPPGGMYCIAFHHLALIYVLETIFAFHGMEFSYLTSWFFELSF